MRKKMIFSTMILAMGLFVASCGGKESAASIAKKWCDLNGKVYKAADGPAKEAAEKARKQFEDEMEAKYKNDKAFMDEIEKEAEKCEDASEGK